jgi:hypothetical protein
MPTEFNKPTKSCAKSTTTTTANSYASSKKTDSLKQNTSGIAKSAEIPIELVELWATFEVEVNELINSKDSNNVQKVLRRICTPSQVDKKTFNVVNNSHADILFCFRSILKDVFEERIFSKEKLDSCGELKMPGWPCRCDIMFSIGAKNNQKLPVFLVEVKNPTNFSGNSNRHFKVLKYTSDSRCEFLPQAF